MTSERRSPFQKYNDRIKSLEGELEKKDKDIKELQERLNKLENILTAQAPAKTPKRGTAKHQEPFRVPSAKRCSSSTKDAKPKQQAAAPKQKFAALKAKKLMPVAEEVAIPSDNLFIDEKKPEMVKSAFKRTQKRYKLKSTYINSPLSELTMNKSKVALWAYYGWIMWIRCLCSSVGVIGHMGINVRIGSFSSERRFQSLGL